MTALTADAERVRALPPASPRKIEERGGSGHPVIGANSTIVVRLRVRGTDPGFIAWVRAEPEYNASSGGAGERDRWALAGDQLYVDLDLGLDNLPPGTRLQIREAVLEVTAPPHTGCAKFSARFGSDALRWVNSKAGRALNLRGIHARVVVPGQVHRGDPIRKS